MVNRRGSDAAPPPTPIAPVVKRKRRASCLGEQERRERKRAIDREAQRSLREKTKTHIAELERTIQILRDQDKNGATASLLSEIEALRAENERLRDVIDSVKNVVGSELFPRSAAPANPASGGGGNSPGMTNGDQHSPKPRTNSMSRLSSTDSKPALPTPVEHLSNPFDFHQHVLNTSGMVDLDGMTVMTNMPVHPASATDPNLGMNIDLDPVKEIPEEEEGSLLDVPDSPDTAAFAPYMSEIFGTNWRCPSPVILHIGNPNADSLSSSVSSAPNNALCPIWKKSNELFGKVFSYRAPAVSISTGTGTHYYHHNNYSFQASTAAAATALEAGILFLGIKQGWDLTSGWKQSPALSILKSVDEFLFCHLPKMERLAVAYKSFKLLKYYLNDTNEELERVPKWLRPSIAQTRTNHPVAIDFFAWPTLRDRLVQNHQEIFQTQDLSRCYSHFLHFDWPFAFEDSFFYDEAEQAYFPCPIFERYHEDLRYWTVGEEFYSEFPEMREDIEGDRARFMVDVV